MIRCIRVVDREAGDATVVTEPSSLPDWAGFLSRVDVRLPSADVLVVSGSVPVDLPFTACADGLLLVDGDEAFGAHGDVDPDAHTEQARTVSVETLNEDAMWRGLG